MEKITNYTFIFKWKCEGVFLMIAVVYYAYGAPKSVDDVEPYFSHILKGKNVPAPMLNNIVSMFKTSGYSDFIRSSVERISKGLQHALNRSLQQEVRVYPAYKHTAPFVKDVYKEIVEAGATTIVTLPINPILSATGGGAIHTEIAELNKEQAIQHIRIDNYHQDEGVVAVFADRVKRAFDWLPVESQAASHVLFTVHSQPLDEERNTPYVKQFNELAAAVAKQASIKNYQCVYRSGKKEGWLAPDVKEAMTSLTNEGAKGFVTCELLSVSADVESFVEINPECKELAKELGVDFAVSEFLGDSYDLILALADLVESRVKASVLV